MEHINQKNNLTTGSISGSLIKFALPLIASNLFQLLYSTIDMAVVGNNIGESGVAAIASAGEIINLCTFMCIGFCVGGQTLVAQLVGSKRNGSFNDAIHTMLISALGMGLFFMVSLMIFRNSVIHILRVPADSVVYCNNYLAICLIGMVFNFGYNAISSVLRGFGDSRHPFIFVTISTCINIVFDLLLVSVLKWGVTGAAIATSFGQIIAFIIALSFILKHEVYEGYVYKPREAEFKTSDFKIITNIGFPLALQSGAVHFSMLYVNRLINQLGTIAAATFAVGLKINDLCSKTTLGMQYSGGPMVAQNFACKEYDRVRKTVYWVWLYTGIFHLVFAITYLLFNQWLFKLFLGNHSRDVLVMAPVFVKSIIWTFIPLTIIRGTNSLLQGTGNGKLSLVFGIIDSVIFRIGLSTLFGLVMGMGFSGFTFGYGLAPLGAALPGLFYFLSNRWTEKEKL